MRLQNIDLVVLLILTGFCALAYQSVISKNSFSYDEADYMLAASRGLYANYTDENTIPFSTFLELGLNRGLEKENRTSLSDFIRNTSDIALYRHFHGPLSFYGLIGWRNLVKEDEYALRWISLLFSIASLIAVYLGCFFLLKENTRTAGILASTLLLASFPNMVTATEISTHAAYILTAITTLLFMAKLLQTNDLRYWYATIIALAFSFATSEYALFLFSTVGACVFLHRAAILSHRSAGKVFAVSLLLFIGVLFIIWPGSLLKLGLVRNYVFYAYHALVSEAEFGLENPNSWMVWKLRVFNSPVEYTLIAATTVLAILKAKNHRWYLPFLVYALMILMTTTLSGATSYERYVSSLFPPLYVVSGLIISQFLQTSTHLIKRGALAVVISLLLGQAYSHVVLLREQRSQTDPMEQILDYFRSNPVAAETILTNRTLLPMLRYYFPRNTYHSYTYGVDGLEFVLRKLKSSAYDGVIIRVPNNSFFEQKMRRYFAMEPKMIFSFPNDKIIYYKLIKTLPSA
jgi:hypothetical protein